MRIRSLLVLCLAPAPVFRIDGPEAPRIITFERRFDAAAGGSDTAWHLLRRSDTTVTAPLQLTYGIVPDGYRAIQPADSLVAATYRLYAKLSHAGGALFFTVAADGDVRRARAAR